MPQGNRWPVEKRKILLKRAVFMELKINSQCLALCTLGALALGIATPLMAQVPPTDAGRLLEQVRPALQAPAPARETGLVAPPASTQSIAPGGERVSILKMLPVFKMVNALLVLYLPLWVLKTSDSAIGS